MTRTHARFAVNICGALLSSMVACGGDQAPNASSLSPSQLNESNIPTPAGQPITENFAGVLGSHGELTFSFKVVEAGPITATLTELSGVRTTVAMDVGPYDDPADGCGASYRYRQSFVATHKLAVTVNDTLMATAPGPGPFCASVWTNEDLPAAGVDVSVRVTHY